MHFTPPLTQGRIVIVNLSSVAEGVHAHARLNYVCPSSGSDDASVVSGSCPPAVHASETI